MFGEKLRSCALSAAFGLTLAQSVHADPSLGIGLTVTFGGDQPQVGAGMRVFSDDEEDEIAASLGFDYLSRSHPLQFSNNPLTKVMDKSSYVTDPAYVEK